jgi:hypothetical protein
MSMLESPENGLEDIGSRFNAFKSESREEASCDKRLANLGNITGSNR